MADINSNILLVILVVVIIIAIVCYLQKRSNNPQTVTTINEKYTDTDSNIQQLSTQQSPKSCLKVNNNLVNQIVDKYGNHYNRRSSDNSNGYHLLDPTTSEYASVPNGRSRRYVDCGNNAFNYDEEDPNEFTHKKKKYVRSNKKDIDDLFDVTQYLPHEIEQEWFDTEPLQCTKQIKGAQLMHPKFHIGTNTVGASKKYATHDVRGDIPNPKYNVGPWMMSTIEHDTNIVGFCKPGQ